MLTSKNYSANYVLMLQQTYIELKLQPPLTEITINNFT